MAKNYITPELLQNGNMWLKHTFFPIVNDEPGDNIYTWRFSRDEIDSNFRLPFKRFLELIRELEWTDEYDALLKTMAAIEYSDAYRGVNEPLATRIKFTTKDLATIFANMLKMSGINYDDTDKSDQEKKYFMEDTLFGSALKAFGRFISIDDSTIHKANSKKYDISNSGAEDSSNNTGTATSKVATNNQNPVQQPQSNQSTVSTTASSSAGGVKVASGTKWKDLGPLSSKVRDLKGSPGVKLKAASKDIYKLVDQAATQIKGKEVRAYIKPLSPNAEINGTNKVFVGSNNNGGDCVCFFDDLNDAKEFLSKIAPIYSGTLTIVRTSARQGGYFVVGTELGDVGIIAANLNEDVLDTDQLDSLNEDDSQLEENFELNPIEFESEEEYNKLSEKLWADLNRYTE